MKAVSYSRYSREDSTDKSIADQEAAIDRYAAKIGAAVIRRYADHAISEATLFIRSGVTTMLRDLEHLSADLVVVDHSDRLMRDEGDMALIFKQLAFQGMELHSVAHGKVDRNTASIMAIVGRNQLESSHASIISGNLTARQIDIVVLACAALRRQRQPFRHGLRLSPLSHVCRWRL